MLHELFEFGERVTNAYDNFAFNRGNILGRVGSMKGRLGGK